MVKIKGILEINIDIITKLISECRQKISAIAIEYNNKRSIKLEYIKLYGRSGDVANLSTQMKKLDESIQIEKGKILAYRNLVAISLNEY